MAIKLKSNAGSIELKQGMLKGDKGDPGEPGAPGKTPVKGVDYFTTADIENLIEDNDLATRKYVDTVVENVEGGGSVSADAFGYSPGAIAESLYHGFNSARVELTDSATDEEFAKTIQQGMLVLNAGSAPRTVYIPLTHGLNGMSVCKIEEDGTCDDIITPTKDTFVVERGQYALRFSNNGYTLADSWNALEKHFRNIVYDNTSSGLEATTLPAAIDELKGMVDSVDLEPYALKTDLDGFLRQSALEGYMTKADTKTFVFNQGYQTAQQVQAAIEDNLSAIGVAEDGAY